MRPTDTTRMAAEMDGGFVIYINGMRLNKLRAIHTYVRAGLKLAKMFKRLEQDPDSGFLGYQPAFMGLRTGAAIQYWRSLDDIRRFAQDPDDLHVPAWTWYNQVVDSGGGVGFWAELYVIEDGQYETFFRNMPPIGLGSVGEFVPMAAHARRLGMTAEGSTPCDRLRPEDADDGA
ncbi:MAG: DUF4188 domain-containing protein [Halobacteriales archaeon]|nr:DUF4188 domain-containing protein [Halobacteriales archaeon]